MVRQHGPVTLTWVDWFNTRWLMDPIRCEHRGHEGARANAACAVALIDRLTHHAEIITIEGESYRKREAEQKAKAQKSSRKSK
jgi:hypothetical protein